MTILISTFEPVSDKLKEHLGQLQVYPINPDPRTRGELATEKTLMKERVNIGVSPTSFSPSSSDTSDHNAASKIDYADPPAYSPSVELSAHPEIIPDPSADKLMSAGKLIGTW